MTNHENTTQDSQRPGFWRAFLRDTPAFQRELKPVFIPVDASRIHRLGLEVVAGVLRLPVEREMPVPTPPSDEA